MGELELQRRRWAGRSASDQGDVFMAMTFRRARTGDQEMGRTSARALELPARERASLLRA
jgi:hypothetical protein